MTNAVERWWVSWVNSDGWRQFAKWGAGARFFRSRAYRKVNMARRFATTYYKSSRQTAVFEDVATFCMFVGHVKSGGTLLGSLLDAHPDVILADEVDVLQYVAAGFSRDQIFHILLKGSQREALKGRVTARRLTPYSFAVPNQWQGRFQKLQVIGDSKAGPTTRQLGQQPALLPKLQERMTGVDTRILHVIRNPFDPISIMMVRGKRSFANAFDHYFDYCVTLTQLRSQLDEKNLFAVRYEDLIDNPRFWLTRVCEFLGVAADSDYLDACAGILHPSPDVSRRLVQWDPSWIQSVEQKMAQFDFLAGYRFEETYVGI